MINVGPSIITSNLICCLDALSTRSYSGDGDTWFDLSGNNRNGTRAGSVKPTHDQSGWFNFSGGVTGNQYSYFNISTPTMNNFTIEVVARSYTNVWQTILSLSNDNVGLSVINNQTYVHAGENYLDINIVDVGIVLSTWNHLAFTWLDNRTLTYYLNGSIRTLNIRSTPDSNGIAAGTFRIGTDKNANASAFIGDVALFRLYNAALTADQIKNNFYAHRNRFVL